MSPNTPEQNAEFAARLGLSFPVLSDPDLSVTDAYGVRHAGASRMGDLPYPTTFVLRADGTVGAKFENETYRVRPESGAVLAALLEAAGA